MATLEQRITKAEHAYNNAQSLDDWKHAAKLLFGVRKQAKKPRRSKKGRYPFPIAVATFTNGVTRRMTFWSAHDKPLDWNRAERLCRLSYRNRYGKQATPPPIVRLLDEISGEVAYDL